ncbi:MAG: hypothetical protein D6819_00460 [Gammaproteobacteria bacterium]|nr:MAG: hypothetical protein D6819_00460 [Gammaproteobacteria bacterium]
MAADSKTLLFIVEQGGYPLDEDALRRQGYRIATALSMRKALSLLKNMHPVGVIAEFNPVTAFRDRISNLEPLLARLQTHHPGTALVVLAEKETAPLLEPLKGRYPSMITLFYPVSGEHILKALQEAFAR